MVTLHLCNILLNFGFRAAARYLDEAKAAYAMYGAHAKLQLLDANYKGMNSKQKGEVEEVGREWAVGEMGAEWRK